MKKFLVIGLILSLSLISCPGPHDPVVHLTFEEAVQEVYEIVAVKFIYSKDGKTMDNDVLNRITGSNEVFGLCTDYSLEFSYHWNEVKNYDELYGKAYPAWAEPTFYIVDVNYVPDGTSKLRENSGGFGGINTNLQEIDGILRDAIITSIIYSGKNILHFGNYQKDHMWVVINIGDDWYDTDPTAYDIYGVSRWNYYAPIKINF